MVLRTDYTSTEQAADAHPAAHNDANAVVNQLETDVGGLQTHVDDQGWSDLAGNVQYISDASGSLRSTFRAADVTTWRVRHGMLSMFGDLEVEFALSPSNSNLMFFHSQVLGRRNGVGCAGTWRGDLGGVRYGILQYAANTRLAITDPTGANLQVQIAAGDKFRFYLNYPTSLSDT